MHVTVRLYCRLWAQRNSILYYNPPLVTTAITIAAYLQEYGIFCTLVAGHDTLNDVLALSIVLITYIS